MQLLRASLDFNHKQIINNSHFHAVYGLASRSPYKKMPGKTKGCCIMLIAFTPALAAHRMVKQVQTCLLNLQSITHRSSAIPCRPFTLSQAHEVHTFIFQSPTFSSMAQLLIWFSCFSYLCTKNMEFLPPHILQSQTLHLDIV